METILLGSCGGLVGIYLAQYYSKLAKNIRLIGSDINPDNACKFFVEKIYPVPGTKDEHAFISAVTSLIDEQKVDYYIPTHSTEYTAVVRHRAELKARCILSPNETVEKLSAKKSFYNALDEVGLRYPRMYTSIEDICKYPLVGKPDIGSGSKGIRIINTEDEASAAMNQGLLLVDLLKGKEFTVDAIFSEAGTLITYNQRIRLKTMGGGAIICKNDFEYDTGDDLRAISKLCKICGPANFQFFMTDNGPFYFDANLRFASGGLPLSVESGADIPGILLKMLRGEAFDWNQYQSDRKPRKMYRVFGEYYEV